MTAAFLRPHGVTRMMQGVLLIIVGFGVYWVNAEIIFSGLFSLSITLLPALLKRNYRVSLGPRTTAWLTFFVLLHAIGTLGPYDMVWWWDDMLHTFLTAVIAGIAFAVVRVLDEYHEEIVFPDQFIFVFLLLFTMAAGVFWEIVEFFIEEGYHTIGQETVVVQYSVHDTVTDLLYNTAGGLIVAGGGHVYFNTAVEHILSSRNSG